MELTVAIWKAIDSFLLPAPTPTDFDRQVLGKLESFGIRTSSHTQVRS